MNPLRRLATVFSRTGPSRRGGPAPLSCQEVAERLQAYLDGEVDETTAGLVADHLEVCRMCGLEAETYERIKTALAAERPEVPPDSLARLRQFGDRLARGEAPGPEPD